MDNQTIPSCKSLHTRRADRAALSRRRRRKRVGAGWLNAEDSAALNRMIPTNWAATGITSWVRLDDEFAVCRQDAGPCRTDGGVSWQCCEEQIL